MMRQTMLNRIERLTTKAEVFTPLVTRFWLADMVGAPPPETEREIVFQVKPAKRTCKITRGK